MRIIGSSRPIAAALALLIFCPSTTQARRVVIDAELGLQSAGGYCSPLEASRGSAECSPVALPFQIKLGQQSFDSFVVNSNGVLSLGSIADRLASQNSFTYDGAPLPYTGGPLTYTGPTPYSSLTSFGVPVFSPFLADNPVNPFLDGDNPAGLGFDGLLAAEYSIGSGQLTVDWFTCTRSSNCGPISQRAIAALTFDVGSAATNDLYRQLISAGFGLIGCLDANRDEAFCSSPAAIEAAFEAGKMSAAANPGSPVYSLTLASSGDGFSATYSGSPGLSGYSLPTGVFEQVGAGPQTIAFDANGFRINSAVPEPDTWALMLVGFGAIGSALRRRRSNTLRPAAAV
jgi:hypothetical protein